MSPRAGLDREAVIRAAAELADSEGLEALSMSSLAARLGVRTPSLYNHVDGLPDLRRELALSGLRDLKASLTWAAVGKTGPEGLAAIAQAYRAYIKEHPGVYAATIRPAAEAPDAELEAVSRETVQVVLRVLAAYQFSEDTALHAVRALRSVVHGFATLELAGGFGLPLSVEESFRRLVQMLIDGLEAHAETSEAMAEE